MSIISFSDIPITNLLSDKKNATKRNVHKCQNVNDGKFLKNSSFYSEKNLNSEQLKVYEYVEKNPKDIILLQAGPGCGKTHTMLTIAYNSLKPVHVIIFKHDLLFHYEYCCQTWTIAKFVMKMLNLQFYDYKTLETQINGRLSSLEFTAAIIDLIRQANICEFENSIVILDEYTVMSKPFLFVILSAFKVCGIGTIICGDKNQLQNIQNSKHARLTSFHIANNFSDFKCFELSINMRCSNFKYNKIIEYISQFSSDRKANKFAFAMIAAIFFKKLVTQATSDDVHIAATHQELADVMHGIVMRERIPVSYYYIHPGQVTNDKCIAGTRQTQLYFTTTNNKSQKILNPYNGLYEPHLTQVFLKNKWPKRFLPYLPLIEGAKYFYKTYSEHSQVILRKIINIDTLVICEDEDGNLFNVVKCINNDVMFDLHKEAILGTYTTDPSNSNSSSSLKKGLGKIYNFPLYPTFLMSIHMCQGRTITNKLNLILSQTTYQGVYVAISRVRSPKQINHIEIPSPLTYLVSTIVNVPTILDNCDDDDEENTIDIKQLQLAMNNNYEYFQIPPNQYHISNLVVQFIHTKTKLERDQIKSLILSEIRKFHSEFIYPPNDHNIILSSTSNNDFIFNNKTMEILLQKKEIFTALSVLPRTMCNRWLVLYKKFSISMQMCYESDEQSSNFDDHNFIRKFTDIINMRNMNSNNIRDSIKKESQLSQYNKKLENIIEKYEINELNMVYHTDNKFNYELYMALKNETCNEQFLLQLLKNTILEIKNKKDYTNRSILKQPQSSKTKKNIFHVTSNKDLLNLLRGQKRKLPTPNIGGLIINNEI